MKELYSSGEVSRRIDALAEEIAADHTAIKPLFVCLLKGAVPFTARLMTAITRHDPTFHPEVEYLHISAYGNDREAGIAEVYSGIDSDVIHGRHVIVIDDCLDQGITYTKTREYLNDQGAASVRLAVLACKDVIERSPDITPDYACFDTPNVWLVGMGMDDSATAPEAERWADYIGDVSS